MSNLRSRSRSRVETRRSAASSQRRSASCQPIERKASSKLAEAKKRRSLSRPANKTTDLVDLTKDMTAKTSKPKSRSRSKSAARATPITTTMKNKNWGADIINLVDQEDEILDELLNSDSPASKQLRGKSPKRKTSAGSAHESPKSVGRFPGDSAYSDEDESSDDDDSEDEVEEVDARDLLAQVNARMEQQRLMEEAKELRSVIEKKNAEIEQLTGQLRMAISTKCDLVIAHTELERLHEQDMKVRETYADDMKRSNLYLMEVRAEVEKEFMNELTQLSQKVQESEERRKKDVEEKDLTIKLLEQKIYRMEKNALQGSSARPDSDKVKFYKKKLGVIDQ